MDDSTSQTKITYDMIKDDLNKRVSVCFIAVVIIMFLLCGCNTTKWEWVPKNQGVNSLYKESQRLKSSKDEEIESGQIKLNVLEVKF